MLDEITKLKEQNALLVEALETVKREAEPGQELNIHDAIDQLAGCYEAAFNALENIK